MMSYWPFTLAAGTDPPALGELGFDVAPPYRGRVTRLYVHDLDRDGALVKRVILGYRPPVSIYVHGAHDAGAALVMTAAPVERPGYVEIPVACTTDDGGLAPGPVDAYFVPEGSQV